MNNAPIIEVAALRVAYGGIPAVDGLSLAVAGGEIFGLLGPNGAGKTTTLACIEGLRRPDAGSVRVAGYDLARDAGAAKQLLGVQLQSSELFTELSLIELLELYAALYGCFPSRAQLLGQLEQFGLAHKARARARQLSGGQQQRFALALALVNSPQIVLLDEPTTGLDPQARRVIWALVRRLQAEGRTVLLTTHSMEEAQELCDRVAIIEAGRLVALGAPAELIARHAPPRPPEEAARRPANLEDVFIALVGHAFEPAAPASLDAEAAWIASIGVS